jgi:nitroreductase
VRWYKDQTVSEDLIVQAVNLAALAPSACNRQPFRFYISSNKQKAVEIAKCAGGTSGWAEGIPCTIAIIGDLSMYPKEKDRHLIYIDSSLAAMQLMLAFETLGLATCAINWPDVKEAENKLKKIVNLRSYERPIMLISVGYPDEQGGIPYSQKKSNRLLIKKI